jgi:hypothetical protein
MDRSHLMPSNIPEDAPNESIPFSYDIPFRRLYQAYCITEASSRPSSPDSLIPKPLRTSAPSLFQTAINTGSADTEKFEQNDSGSQASASDSAQHIESVTLRKTGQYSKRQTPSSNQKPLWERTRLGNNPSHITRAVTPRGSHSLASSEVITYDRPPSHPRMQQLGFANKNTVQPIPRKPIERLGDRVSTYQRPWPPLPLETASAGSERSQAHSACSGNAYRKSCKQLYTQHPLALLGLRGFHTETSRPYKPNEYLIPQRPLPDPPVETRPSLSGRSATSEERTTPQSLKEHSNDVGFRGPSRSPRERNFLNRYPQNASAAELYVPRDHWDDVDDGVRAPRRTGTRVANLKQQFRQLPSQHSASPLLVSPQSNSYLQPIYYLANSAPSPHSSTDIQNGPRPPPWGSYEELEIQRRQRGDARERAKIRANRLTADSASTYQKSLSTDSLSESPSREVEEYREQILGVYPDMEFNGDAGRGDRGWCCCVMM